MARLAIDKAGVIKGNILPIVGDVAIGTLTLIVGRRRCMARLTIGETTMTKVPATGVVALGALVRVVIGFAMATCTVAETRVVEPIFGPILGIVAIEALPRVMIGRCSDSVATRTIC